MFVDDQIDQLQPNNDLGIELKYTAIVEANQFHKPAGLTTLPGEVLSAGTGVTSSKKCEEEQAFDQNWDP